MFEFDSLTSLFNYSHVFLSVFKKSLKDYICWIFRFVFCVHAKSKSTEIYGINMYVICVCIRMYYSKNIVWFFDLCFRRKLAHISLNVTHTILKLYLYGLLLMKFMKTYCYHFAL